MISHVPLLIFFEISDFSQVSIKKKKKIVTKQALVRCGV
jgi:hypothetical protein